MNYDDYRNCFQIVNESDGQPYTGVEGEFPFVIYNDEFIEKVNKDGSFSQHIDALLKMVNEEFDKKGYKLEGRGCHYVNHCPICNFRGLVNINGESLPH